MLGVMKAIEKPDVASIIERLKRTNLQPSQQVNRLYSELVSMALDPAEGVREMMKLSSGQLREVHEICARGETCLEAYWADRIQRSRTPMAELLDFPYLDNYLKLSGSELALLVKHVPQDRQRKLAYIGTGPLPLTALCCERHGIFDEVVGIDNDVKALAAGRRLCAKLESSLSFIHADAMEMDYSEFSVIFVAALVGMTNEEKQTILAKIRQTARPGTLVAVRSSFGSRELLYPKLTALPARYVEIDSYIPTDNVVNSLHVLKIKGGECA